MRGSDWAGLIVAATVAGYPQGARAATPTSPPTVATARFYMVGSDSQGAAMFIEPARAFFADDIVILPTITMLAKPKQVEGGLLAAWGDGDLGINCKEHRWHMVIANLANPERSQFVEIPGVRFNDWTPIVAGSQMERAEALMCGNRLLPGTVAVNDLVAYARQRGTAPAQAAAPATKADYRLAGVDTDSATLIDKGSFKREGQVITFSELSVFAKGLRLGGKDYPWAETTRQIDCTAHRSRTRVDGYLTLDRGGRVPDPDKKWSPWDPARRGSFAQTVEDFVCSGKGEKDFEPVQNLDQFQKNLAAAVKAGALK